MTKIIIVQNTDGKSVGVNPDHVVRLGAAGDDHVEIFLDDESLVQTNGTVSSVAEKLNSGS
jgi:hypothetical protein